MTLAETLSNTKFGTPITIKEDGKPEILWEGAIHSTDFMRGRFLPFSEDRNVECLTVTSNPARLIISIYAEKKANE
jgi:hypothetical protein